MALVLFEVFAGGWNDIFVFCLSLFAAGMFEETYFQMTVYMCAVKVAVEQQRTQVIASDDETVNSQTYTHHRFFEFIKGDR